VQAKSNNGDSGAPVFERTANPDSVIFDGVLAYKRKVGGKQYFGYSTITRIKNELSAPNIQNLDFKYHSTLISN
jgi:hypothetical protein